MIITTSGGGEQSRHYTRRKPKRSLKAHRAVTVALRAGITLPSYNNRDIYRALEKAGYAWNATAGEWMAEHGC